mmetsp:Transcript_18805/g.50563  ORF Transcript_18805/g.50563 Transcript_18805/m.50563 type:complete len:103 (-) Transcript_18805:539-847(-)
MLPAVVARSSGVVRLGLHFSPAPLSCPASLFSRGYRESALQHQRSQYRTPPPGTGSGSSIEKDAELSQRERLAREYARQLIREAQGGGVRADVADRWRLERQ